MITAPWGGGGGGGATRGNIPRILAAFVLKIGRGFFELFKQVISIRGLQNCDKKMGKADTGTQSQ